MKSVLIVVGHWNIENLTNTALRDWRDVSYLKTSTGASGERDFLWNKLLPRLRDGLIAKGIQVFITDAIYHADTYAREYDLSVALHYDAGGTDERCMISSPLRNANPPYINTGAHDKADQFCKIWKEVYPKVTGAPNQDSRITSGMTEYYAFDYSPMDTPSVIIEHLNATSDHGKYLISNPDLVAKGDIDAICQYLGISTQPVVQPTPAPTTPSITDTTPIALLYGMTPEEIRAKIKSLESSVDTLKKSNSDLDMRCKNQSATIESQDKKITELNTRIEYFKNNESIITDQANGAIKIYVDRETSARTTLYGKGWPWTKINKLKTIYPQK